MEMSLPFQEERNDCLRWLLSACGQWLLQSKGAARQLPFPKDINWKLLNNMASSHSLPPLFHNLMKKEILPQTGLPTDLTKTWEEAYYSVIIQNIEFFTLLSQFSEECKKKNIPFIVLKGPAAVAALYKNIGLRTMVDIDVLCKKKDLKYLSDIAFSLGWQRESEISFYHIGFPHKKLRIPLELHFDPYFLIQNKRIYLNSVWKKKKLINVEDAWFPIMPAEHQVIFELAHILQHGYAVPLRHYLDLAGKLFLQREEINWKALSLLLQFSGLKNEFFSLSSAFFDLLNIPLEIPLKCEISASKISILKKELFDILASIGFIIFPTVGSGVAGEPRLFKKMIYIFKRLVPPISALQVKYNLSSATAAIFFIPLFAWTTLIDFWQRRKRENGDAFGFKDGSFFQ